MADLYIYYKVPGAHADRLAPRVRAMQAALATSHGVAGQLKRRPPSSASQQTWMEIYPATDDDFAAALAAAVRSAGITALIDGERHTEIFMDIIPCA